MGFKFFFSITSRNYRPRNSLKETAPGTTACPSYSIDRKVIFEHILNCDSIVAKAVTFETTSKISAQTTDNLGFLNLLLLLGVFLRAASAFNFLQLWSRLRSSSAFPPDARTKTKNGDLFPTQRLSSQFFSKAIIYPCSKKPQLLPLPLRRLPLWALSTLVCSWKWCVAHEGHDLAWNS